MPKSEPQTEHIYLVIAGGTIDNVCDDLDRNNQNSAIEAFVRESVKPYFELSTKVLFMKDSRDITEIDLRKLANEIEHCQYSHIVITHGTYTMARTAEFLAENVQKFLDKTVIVTGAMIPLGDHGSDAAFNLGFAVHAALTTPTGVFIAMHGKLWNPGEVRKDCTVNRFTPE
mgnify:CR=1 FL=1